MELTTSLTAIKGVGPNIAKKFKALGVNNVAELLDYFPRAHNDYSNISSIKSLRPGLVTISAVIKQAKGRYVRRGMHITEAVASDKTGSVRLVWFNQPYRATAIKPGQIYYITGKLELRRQHFSIMNPSAELASDFPLHTARIIPIYRETKNVNSALIRRTIGGLLKSAAILPDPLPSSITVKYDLLTYPVAVKELHFPSSAENLAKARRSLGFIEVFELILASTLNKQIIEHENAPKINFNIKEMQSFVKSLPFSLTNAQRKTIWQIFKDMERTIPMNRLIEGDVGSGKTVVAAMAGLVSVSNGYQVALLAPTEILARQHAETISELMDKSGYKDTVSLLTGKMTVAQKRAAYERIRNGNIAFIIGTQALLQERIAFLRLGLLIIDEQHRFGVEQRKILLKKSKLMPHVLSMTATPIPRSLALTLYGDLDISLLDEMPPGRKPIITKIISPNSRDKMYEFIAHEIDSGKQAYMVCPIITDSFIKGLSAEALYKNLQAGRLKKYRLGILHGKLTDQRKEKVMDEFKTGNIDILVSTTVIEVGVSVNNASVMVIEGADRFGLAQMHQLRGRVGRSSDQGYCFIVPSDSQAPSQRLKALEKSVNGFELAELDLELRGPGAIYGKLQHGALDLKMAKLTDAKLLSEARQAVTEFFDQGFKLSTFPELNRRIRLAQAVVTLN